MEPATTPRSFRAVDMGSLAEHALRPHAASLFDMAPKFEDAVLNVLPSAVALFLSPLLLLQCLKQSVHVRNSPLLWLKLVRNDPRLTIMLAQLTGHLFRNKSAAP